MTDSVRFFCVRGYMKSGTNWIGRLLNVHPEVDCIGEFHWQSFFDALDQNVDRIAPQRKEMLECTVRPRLREMVRSSLMDLAGKLTGVIGDRTPTTIAPIILDVPHILMIRDFRDVMVSRMFHLFNKPHVTGAFENFPEMKTRLEKFQEDSWYFKDHPSELLDCESVVRDSAREWSRNVVKDRETIANDSELQVLELRYEELHQDFEAKLAGVFDFLQLQPPESIPKALHPGHASEDPTQFNRRGQIGDWKRYFTDQQLGWIQDEAGQEMELLGYC